MWPTSYNEQVYRLRQVFLLLILSNKEDCYLPVSRHHLSRLGEDTTIELPQ